MSTGEIIGLVATVLVLGTVYPLLGLAWFQLVSKVNAIEETTITRREFKAHMQRLDESNIRIETAMGIMPRRRSPSQDSEAP